MNEPKLTGLDLLLKEVANNVEQSINEKSNALIADLQKQVEDLKKYTPTVVIRNDIKTQVTGLRHKQLNSLIAMVGAGLNVMITGMAGTGKTKSAQQVADALGLNFYCMSVGAQTSKSDLLGYMDAQGNYVDTMFRRAYENGGVFVMDEIDAGNANVLIVMNSALSNGVCAFPDKMVAMHKDFHFIATANTYGNGADRTYVGRNQLDGATLDRFACIDWKIDEDLEEALVEGLKYNKVWLEVIREIRKYAERQSMRAIISPRATIKGATILEVNGGNFEEAYEATVNPQLPFDKRYAVKELAKNTFDKAVKEHKPEASKTTQDKPTGADSTTEPEYRGRGWNFKKGAPNCKGSQTQSTEPTYQLL